MCEITLDKHPIALRDKFIDRERFDHWLTTYRASLSNDATNDAERRQAMQAVNPKYILRNYLAQEIIEKTARGDTAEIDRFLTVLQTPFADHPSMTHYAEPAPAGGADIQVSCSS